MASVAAAAPGSGRNDKTEALLTAYRDVIQEKAEVEKEKLREKMKHHHNMTTRYKESQKKLSAIEAKRCRQIIKVEAAIAKFQETGTLPIKYRFMLRFYQCFGY